MKFLTPICLALCLFVVVCHGVPVERETLLSIEQSQPVAVVGTAEQPQQLRRVARGFGGGFGRYPGFGYGGYGGYPGYGGFGGYPGYGGYGGYPGYGGFGGYPGYGGYGGYPIGGFGGSYSSASAIANAGGVQFFG